MRIKHLRPLLAAAISACALLALGAGSASAITWSNTASGWKWTGTVTLKLNGGNAKTCTSSVIGAFDTTDPAEILGQPNIYGFYCGVGSNLDWAPVGYPYYDAGYGLDLYDDRDTWGGSAPLDPWGGSWWFTEAFVPFANGSGSTPSTVTFSNTLIGYSTTQLPITATGTLSMKTSSGGLLTLSGT